MSINDNTKDLSIKRAAAEDLKALCDFEIEARITEPEIWIQDFNEEEYRKSLENINFGAMENNKIVVAEQDGKIIGRCDIAIILSLVDCEKIGYIDWVYVLKDKRGIGIAKKLFKGAEEYFKSKGVKRYYLFTAENEQAHEFYHRQKDLEFSKQEIAEKELL